MSKTAVVSVSATDAATLAAKLEAAHGRAEALEQRNAILEARSELQDTSMAQVPIYLTAFAIILTFITVLTSVVMFVLTNRATNEAKAEARNVARDAIDATRKELTDLQNTVVAAQVQAQEKIEEVGRLAEQVREIEAKARASLSNTEGHEQSAARYAIELFEKGQDSGLKPEERSKSPEVAKALKAAEVESRKTAQDEWSPEQYQSAINKALWLDEDISRAESLANAMLARFADDPAASACAHEALGDVAVKREEWTTALTSFEEAYLHLDKIRETETASALRIRHQLGYVLNELGRTSKAEALFRELVPKRSRLEGKEAWGTIASRFCLAFAVSDQGRVGEGEAILRELLPLCEQIYGAETSHVLAMRHELAFALLDQGRTEEAEAMLRDLVPLCERVDGAEKSSTLTTRHLHARAIFELGNATEAEAMYRELLPLCERVDGPEAASTVITRYCLAEAALENDNITYAVDLMADMPDASARSDWSPRHVARIAFVRGKLCDAQGESYIAARHLSEARDIYAQFPPEYAPRAKFEAYLAARGGLD
ncbi:MAG: hypothetical protein C0471_01865 [Erythrobacter sp.]|nr:hypothetical protein [Erythrobacter sp.]